MTAVENLLEDIENEICEFQSETEEEDNAIIAGLLELVEKIKKS